MSDKLRSLFHKYREVILYVVFGVLTTLVNWLSYYVLTRAFSLDVTPAAVAAWAISVLFAYVTNRRWVFDSKARGFKSAVMELATFVSGRIATGVMDIALLNAAVSLGINDALAKAVINVLVISANYVISKFIVFRK